VAFYFEADNAVFVGDVLFKGSIGRTDLPKGDYATLIRSIQSKLLPLPDSTVVYSGHGPTTTIIEEKTNNPYL
jgi:glyoxylase-like metal-dependent hydrolase (beta-lactamase superfamily II)